MTTKRKGSPVHFWTLADKEAWQAFAAKYGQTLGEMIEQAVRRHMEYPPPLPDTPAPVPLPDVVKRPRGRPKKKS